MVFIHFIFIFQVFSDKRLKNIKAFVRLANFIRFHTFNKWRNVAVDIFEEWPQNRFCFGGEVFRNLLGHFSGGGPFSRALGGGHKSCTLHCRKEITSAGMAQNRVEDPALSVCDGH